MTLSDLFNHIRGVFASWRIANRSIGGNHLCISRGVKIHHPECVSIGNRVFIGKGEEIYPYLSDHSAGYPKICIGDRVCLGDYNRLACSDSLIIEDDVLFAAYVHISDHSHEYRNVDLPIWQQGIFSKGPVRIGKGSWLGFRAEILSGVTIGEHCIIAAGAVVTKDVPSYSIVAGVPAKVISQYDFQTKQ